MYCNDDFATERDSGIVISVYNELLNEKAVGDEFCWGYYLRIENNSPDKLVYWAEKSLLPTSKVAKFQSPAKDLAANCPNWNREKSSNLRIMPHPRPAQFYAAVVK